MVDLYPIEDREGGVRRRELSGILAPSSGLRSTIVGLNGVQNRRDIRLNTLSRAFSLGCPDWVRRQVAKSDPNTQTPSHTDSPSFLF
jgi:hypothetical protein